MEPENNEYKDKDNKSEHLNENLPQTVDEYIKHAPIFAYEKLSKIRSIIQETAPDAKEKISWKMPTYDYYGNLVHFAFNKNHLGFYPGESGVRVFSDHLQEYKSSKGAIQFPYDQPLPEELIKAIVLYRIKENEEFEKEKIKNKKKKEPSIC